MKYLLIAKPSKGAASAKIFDEYEDAKRYLKESIENLKTSINTENLKSDHFIIHLSDGASIELNIKKVPRAEYAIIRKDFPPEDRRFDYRYNAINYINEIFPDATEEENDLGYWPNNSKRGCSYKLYAVELPAEEGTHKGIKHYDAVPPKVLLAPYSKEGTKPKSSNKKSKKKKSKKKKIVIILLFLIGVGVFTWLNVDWQLVSDEIRASQLSPSYEVKQLADSLYLTRKGRSVYFASNPKLLDSTEFNKTCGKDGKETFTSGCYYKDDNNEEHLEIYQMANTTINENGLYYDFNVYKRIVTLHEMLHAVWERYNFEKRSNLCDHLVTVGNQISKLKSDLRYYDDSAICTELFSRIGSEYAVILSPENTYLVDSKIPMNYYDLDSNGKTAIKELVKEYNTYFDTEKTATTVAHWKNEYSLSNFEYKVTIYAKQLSIQGDIADITIRLYRVIPTLRNYYDALNQVNKYNQMVNTYNSYINTINKVIRIIDSEKTYTPGSNRNV